jgi:hypothetical protein
MRFLLFSAYLSIRSDTCSQRIRLQLAEAAALRPPADVTVDVDVGGFGRVRRRGPPKGVGSHRDLVRRERST